MNSGVFAVRCPECGTEIRMVDVGTGVCPTCRQTYHSGLGHLVPISAATADRASRTLDEPGARPMVPTHGRAQRS